MKNTNYKTLSATGHNDFINDFDRMFATVRNLSCNFINCMIEDFRNEASAFFPAKDYLKILYATICQETPNHKFEKIDQYTRCKNPTSASLIKMHSYNCEDLASHNNNDKYMAFLFEANKKLSSANLRDDMSLLYIAMLLWNEWISTKDVDLASKKVYPNAVIYNLVLLLCKNALNSLKQKAIAHENTNENALAHSGMLNYIAESIQGSSEIKQNVTKMVEAYDEICREIQDFQSLDLDVYFRKDLPVIHRISVRFLYLFNAYCE